MKIFILLTNLHLFQAVFMREKEDFYILDIALQNSPYLKYINEKQFIIVDLDQNNTSGIQCLLYFKAVKTKLDSLQEKIPIFKSPITLVIGQPFHFSSSLLVNLYPNANIFLLDDGLSTQRKSKEFLQINPIKKWFLNNYKKILVPIIYKLRNFEYLYYFYPSTFYKNSNKVQLCFFPESVISTCKKQAVADYVDIKKILQESQRHKTLKKIHFLSFHDAKPSSAEDVCYIGHPRKKYKSDKIKQNVASELLVIANDCIIDESSLSIISEWGKSLK